jgi:hypothetical protein
MTVVTEDLKAHSPEAADADWFRPPTRRERWIAAGLFLGFGAFFFAYSFVWTGSWFRWAILGLGVWSVVYALGHARRAIWEGEAPSEPRLAAPGDPGSHGGSPSRPSVSNRSNEWQV